MTHDTRDLGTPSSSPDAPEAIIGGRFHVLGGLGHGGMASVYRVRDQISGKELAVKRLRITSDRSQALLSSLFEREFYTLAELSHPRIIEVYDYGVDERGAYYAMELLGGADLRERGKLPWQEACALLRDVASSLAILHSRRLLHCDLTPRNVRCTVDGHAKLLDFGAMMPMGVPKTLAGTAPFVAPEMLQLQALDGRADLFSLGALGYWILTGTTAYPARTFADLHEVWRRAPAEPRQLEPQIPEPVSALVMELLELDRESRPRSAAEVMERLTTIAGLTLEELPAVTQAYLVTPTLVGREDALAEARDALGRIGRGAGTTIVIDGASGMGRSRYLDACVFEAKRLGATVLRAEADDGVRSDYGVIRYLASQLFVAQPDLARQLAHPWRMVLSHLIEELALDAVGRGSDHPKERPERRHLHSALSDWLLAVAQHCKIVLAVDDLEYADEPSVALLAMLAYRNEGRALGIVATAGQTASTPALDLLRRAGIRQRLAPLAPEQTEALMRAVFGEADNAMLVGRFVHQVSEGSPRAAMELAQHLVDQRIARYEAGSWILPSTENALAMPASLAAARRSRLSALSPDARALGEAMALTDPALLSLENYPELSDHGDRARTYRALDELLAAGIVTSSGQRNVFSQRSWAELFEGSLSAPRKRELHGRLAKLAMRSSNRARLAFHLMEAGQTRHAVDLLLELKSGGDVSSFPLMLNLLERAIDDSDALGLTLQEQLELRIALVGIASHIGEHDRFTRFAPGLLEQLKRASGLVDWHELSNDLSPPQRLDAAYKRAEQRYLASAEAERGLHPLKAIQPLARLCASFGTMAGIANEPELLENVPSLVAFAPLSPAIGVAELAMNGMKHAVICQVDTAASIFRAALARISQPDRAGLDELSANATRYGMLYMIGTIEALLGVPTAADHVAELKTVPGQRANAWRTQRLVHMMQGDLHAASEAQRHAELLQLQDGEMTARSPAVTDLTIQMLSEDLIGLKQTIERLEQEAQRYPKRRQLLQTARAHYRRLQGDSVGALRELEPVIAEIDYENPRALTSGAQLALGAYLAALTSLNRQEEGFLISQALVRTWNETGIYPPGIAKPVIEGFAEGGRVQDALELADRSIEYARRWGAKGLGIGPLYEARARVALAMKDSEGFACFAKLCSQEYRLGRSGALGAKYARLMQGAERDGVELSSDLLYEISGRSTGVATIVNSVRGRMLECIDRSERARYALALLMEQSGAEVGHLFATRDGRFRAIASVPETEASDALAQAIQRYLQDSFDSEAATSIEDPASRDGAEQPPSALYSHDVGGRRFESMLLIARVPGAPPAIAAVASFCHGATRRTIPRSVLNAVSNALVENGDVEPIQA